MSYSLHDKHTREPATHSPRFVGLAWKGTGGSPPAPCWSFVRVGDGKGELALGRLSLLFTETVRVMLQENGSQDAISLWRILEVDLSPSVRRGSLPTFNFFIMMIDGIYLWENSRRKLKLDF